MYEKPCLFPKRGSCKALLEGDDRQAGKTSDTGRAALDRCWFFPLAPYRRSNPRNREVLRRSWGATISSRPVSGQEGLSYFFFGSVTSKSCAGARSDFTPVADRNFDSHEDFSFTPPRASGVAFVASSSPQSITGGVTGV